MTPLEEQAKTPQEQWAEDSNTAARITELEAALFACAEAAGEDVSDGAPTWPDITTWAVRAVKELRKDYDDASPLLPLEVTDEGPLRVTVDTADLIELLYGATTDSPANRKARTRLSAALTQPQAEQWHENDEADKAATAAGVADADLVRVGDFFGIPAFTHPDVKPGIVGIVSAGEVTAVIADREEPGPYARAFRERVCPVPEFPSVEKGTHE